MKNKCRICSNEVDNVSYKVREMMFGTRDEFDYFKCSSCGCLQIANYVPDVGRYYGGGYYSYKTDPRKNGLGKKIRAFLRGRRDYFELKKTGLVGLIYSRLSSNVHLRLLSRYVSPSIRSRSECRILDVGCGSGSYLKKWHEMGFTHLHGVDPFVPDGAVFNEKFKVFKSDIFSLDGEYDLIFLNHSLEHMENQSEVLSKVSQLLSGHGACVVRIPLADSYAWDFYATDWVQLDAPRHYYLHTVQSLNVLAERSGLRMIGIEYDSSAFQFYGSELYARDIALFAPESKSAFTEEELQNFEETAKRLNKEKIGDQAIFVFSRL